MTVSALQTDLRRLSARAAGAIRLTDPPLTVSKVLLQTRPADLQARVFHGPVRGRWQVSSFSALSAKSGGGEQPDYDASPWLESASEPAMLLQGGPTVFDFPRGARAGRCWHQIFEYLDFAAATPDAVLELARQALAAHGFDPAWAGVTSAMVYNTLRAPLDHSGLCLWGTDSSKRLNEMEFYYPLTHLDSTGLRRVLMPWLEHYGSQSVVFREELEALDFAPARGYMKGFIDLVFESGGRYYIVDYKSNWLGASAEDYTPEKLAEPIAREGYVLQYLIYTIALHRYLKLRLADYDYERHFGGVFYLFLRGMDPARPGYGVFKDWPDPGLIERLDRYLASGQAASGLVAVH